MPNLSCVSTILICTLELVKFIVEKLGVPRSNNLLAKIATHTATLSIWILLQIYIQGMATQRVLLKTIYFQNQSFLKPLIFETLHI